MISQRPELTQIIVAPSRSMDGSATQIAPNLSVACLRKCHKRPGHRGFTLIELLAVLAIINILIGVLVPAVAKVREAAELIDCRNDLRQLYIGMENYWDAYNIYPTVIIDPLFLDILAESGFEQLVAKINSGVHRNGDNNDVYDPSAFPYYILSVSPGGEREKLSWNFRIAAGVGNNPLADAFKSNGDDLWARGVTINPFGEIDNAEIHRSYGEIYPTDGLGYQWFWNEADQVVVLPHAARAQYAIGQALLTARGAEMVTPILEAHPELSTRVRTYVNSPATTAMLLSLYSPDWVAPFLDILGLASVEDVPEISLDDLEGDPGFLFSYESLRMLTTFYSRDSGVTDGLIAKLDAAEAAESMGHTQAKAGQLKAFQNQVRAQTGKALSEPQSRTMLALSKTL